MKLEKESLVFNPHSLTRAFNSKVDKQGTVDGSLNTVTTTGFYKLASTITDGPPGITSGTMVVACGDGESIVQMVFQSGSSAMFLRSGELNTTTDEITWSNWDRVTSLSFADSRYVNVDGDTMTGVLNMQPLQDEGGEIHLNASTANTTQSGIVLDQYNGQLRIFGIASADGTTRTGTGSGIYIDPYAKTVGAGSYQVSVNELASSKIQVNDYAYFRGINLNASGGTNGYVKIAVITIDGLYVNRPIEIGFSRRGSLQVERVNILFQSTNTKDPALLSFTEQTQDAINAFIYKIAESTWELYIKKSEAYGSICLEYINNPTTAQTIHVEVTNVLVTELPEGYIKASYPKGKFNGGLFAENESESWYTNITPGIIELQKITSASNAYGSNNPRIKFSNIGATQNLELVFTDYDSVQTPASLSLIGNQGNEFFIAPRIKITDSLHFNHQADGAVIYNYYNDTNYNLIRNHNNGNISVSASGEGLYLGYENTKFVNFKNGMLQLDGSGNLIFNNSDTYTRQIRWTVGTNDYVRIAAGATAANTGWLEFATSDDGIEPIYVRQYTGVFATAVRTLTLLDGSGNTTIPGNLYFTNASATISFTGTKATIGMIRFLDNTDNVNGNGISIGGGGATIIGGGESATTCQGLLSTTEFGGAERMIIANDGAIEFYSAVQNGTDSSYPMTFNTSGSLIVGNSGKTGDRAIQAVNNNGAVELLTSINRGLYDRTRSSWIIYATNTTDTQVYIPRGVVVSGSISMKTTYNASLANNNVSSITYPTTVNILDSSDRIMVRLEGTINPNGNIGSYWYIRNYKTDGTQVAQKGINMTMAKDGTLTYGVSDPSKFRSAIGAVSTGGDTITGWLTTTSGLCFKNNNYSKGTAPSAETNQTIQWMDNSGYTSTATDGIATIYGGVNASETHYLINRVWQPNTSTTNFAQMALFYPKSGSPYAEFNCLVKTNTSLHIYGTTVGNDASAMVGSTVGVLSWGDTGPKITFDTSATPGGGQAGAIIFTDHDTAGTGVSWHFVSNQTDWNVSSKRFHARTGISVGTDLHTNCNGILIKSGYDLVLRGTTTNDPGDVVFQNSSGTEIGRLFSNGSSVYMRFNSTKNIWWGNNTNFVINSALWAGNSAQNSLPSAGIHVHDCRNVQLTPGHGDHSVNFFFALNGTGSNVMPESGKWYSLLHVRGWEGGYSSWELAGPAHNADQRNDSLYYRASNVNSTWGSWRKVLDSYNYSSYAMPKSGGTFSGSISMGQSGNNSIYVGSGTSGTYAADVTVTVIGSSTIPIHTYNSNSSVTTLTWELENYNAGARIVVNSQGVTFYHDYKVHNGTTTTEKSYRAFNIVGDSSIKTIYLGDSQLTTRLYGSAIYLNNTSTAVTSDRLLKTDFTEFDSRYEQFFINLAPTMYRSITGTSGRLHSGYVAQDVEQALEDAGISTQSFAGLVIDQVDDTGYMDVLGYNPFEHTNKQYYLRYTEFISLNTWMIQKNYKKLSSHELRIQQLEEENEQLKIRITALESQLATV